MTIPGYIISDGQAQKFSKIKRLCILPYTNELSNP
jgi:hypothetical protein